MIGGMIIKLNLQINQEDRSFTRLLTSFLNVNLSYLVILYINVPIAMKKKLYLILVKLDFALHVATNIMKIELFLFSLNYLNGLIGTLFLLSLKI